MKLIFKVVFCMSVTLFGLMACDDSDDNTISGFALDGNEFTLGAEGGSEVIGVTSAVKWVAKVNQPWVKVSPANGIGAVKCQIEVDTTLSNQIREAVITFIPEGEARQEVKIHQTGYGKIIGLSKDVVEVANMGQYGKRFFEISVTTNVDFNIEVPADAKNWLKVDQLPSLNLGNSARPKTTTVRFNWEMNTNSELRTAAVSFIPKNSSDVLVKDAVLTVNQSAGPKIDDSRAGDSLALIIVHEKLQAMIRWDVSERIEHWKGVTVWEKTDKGATDKNIGRVKRLSIAMFNTKESLPAELGKLKYMETLVLMGNTNRHILPDQLLMGNALAGLENLKHLSIEAYGISTLDPMTELTKSMKTLKTLVLRSNNFTSLPSTINSTNFPSLDYLDIGGMRRYDSRKDLRDDVWETNWGMRVDVSTLTNLFRWDKLRVLSLSYGYFYGELPQMKGYNARYYTAQQIAANDTLNSASAENKQRLMTEIPCVLPNIQELRFNLNFLSGALPDWLLYHPRLANFIPDILLFPQENGYDRAGKVPGFSNAPTNLDYFYEFYPATKSQTGKE